MIYCLLLGLPLIGSRQAPVPKDAPRVVMYWTPPADADPPPQLIEAALWDDGTIIWLEMDTSSLWNRKVQKYPPAKYFEAHIQPTAVKQFLASLDLKGFRDGWSLTGPDSGRAVFSEILRTGSREIELKVSSEFIADPQPIRAGDPDEIRAWNQIWDGVLALRSRQRTAIPALSFEQVQTWSVISH